MRTRLPDGSRTAKSRVPHGWSVGSCTISAPAGAQLLEGGVEVVGVEVDAVQRALGEQRGERVAVGGAAVEVVREDDRDAGLGGGADGDPAEVSAGDVVAQLEAERVAVEGRARRSGSWTRTKHWESVRFMPRNAREPGAAALLRSCSVRGSGG